MIQPFISVQQNASKPVAGNPVQGANGRAVAPCTITLGPARIRRIGFDKRYLSPFLVLTYSARNQRGTIFPVPVRHGRSLTVR